MRVALVSRYPTMDRRSWKRDLAERLWGQGIELAVIYSRSSLADQGRAGLAEYGLGGAARRFLGSSGEPSPAPEALAAEGPGRAPEDITLDRWAEQHDLLRHHGRRLGDPETLAWTRAFAPDVLVLAGSDIVPRALLEIPRRLTVNPHYALLPEYRGRHVTEWSVYRDDPVGLTVHAVEAAIDTGDILAREAIAVPLGATLESIREDQWRLTARLLERTVLELAAGSERRVAQRAGAGRQYYRMHEDLLERVRRRLADGTYRWLGVAAPPADLAASGLGLAAIGSGG